MTGGEAGREAPLLSVLVPVYNEAATVEEMLRRVRAVPIAKEIVVVDDGSTDGTREILERVAAGAPEVVVVHQDRNRGKGAALRRAIGMARGRICIVQDADLEYDPRDYAALVQPILDGRTRVVYGSRVLHRENHYPFDRFYLGSWVLTRLANLLYRAGLTDEPTCYKVFDRELLQSIPLRCEGFEFCPEVTARVRRRGERIVEVPIRYRKRSVAEGKKIRWKDGVVGIWTLLRHRFGS
jgi:glycosyltransferase involved in cell wall biosynthesis